MTLEGQTQVKQHMVYALIMGIKPSGSADSLINELWSACLVFGRYKTNGAYPFSLYAINKSKTKSPQMAKNRTPFCTCEALNEPTVQSRFKRLFYVSIRHSLFTAGRSLKSICWPLRNSVPTEFILHACHVQDGRKWSLVARSSLDLPFLSPSRAPRRLLSLSENLVKPFRGRVTWWKSLCSGTFVMSLMRPARWVSQSSSTGVGVVWIRGRVECWFFF